MIGFRAYDNLEKKWVDDEWEARHGWLLMDKEGEPVLIQDVEGEKELRNVEVDFVEPNDLMEHCMRFRDRITFHVTENATWTSETPTKGGWYRHCKGGAERMYFLKPFLFTHPLMPNGVLWAMDGPDAGSGKNIIGIGNNEFAGCEWMGPYSPEPEMRVMESMPLAKRPDASISDMGKTEGD